MGHYMDDVEDLCRKCEIVSHRDGLCLAHWHFHFFARRVAEAVQLEAIKRCEEAEVCARKSYGVAEAVGADMAARKIGALDLDAIIEALEKAAAE